jgi:hypothetical protein
MYAIVPFPVFRMVWRDERVTKQLFARTAPQSEQLLLKASPTRTRSRATHDEYCRRLRSLWKSYTASRGIKQTFFFSCQHQTRSTWGGLALVKTVTFTPENAAETALFESVVACILMNQAICLSET